MSEKKKFDRKQNKYRSHKPFTPPKKFNFTPRSAGHMQCDPGYTWDLPVNHITIHYVYSGKGTFELDGKVYHLKHGDAFVVNYNDKKRNKKTRPKTSLLLLLLNELSNISTDKCGTDSNDDTLCVNDVWINGCVVTESFADGLGITY